MAYNFYFILLKLLKIGIPYNVIFQMSESEIKHIIAIDLAVEERNQEYVATHK